MRWYLGRPLPHCARHDPATRFVLRPAATRTPHHRHCLVTRLIDDNPWTEKRLQLDEQLPGCGRQAAS
jgi:hypothetical protein